MVAVSLGSFLVQERFDADSASLGAKVASEGVRTGELSSTAPASPGAKLALADKFLLAGMQTFMSFSVVLPRKRLPTYRTYKRPFVSVGTQV